MNSQCNGSFAQNQRADAGGNRRVLKNSLFSLSGFFGEAPLPPQDAHVGPRWATWHPMEPFYDPEDCRNVGQTCVFSQKTQDLRRFYDEQAIQR
jgi:hypothetical protein